MPWMLTDLPCGVRDGSHAEGKRIRDASCGAVRCNWAFSPPSCIGVLLISYPLRETKKSVGQRDPCANHVMHRASLSENLRGLWEL